MPVESTTRTAASSRIPLALVLLLLMTSSCDCDDKIRKMISNPGERGKTPTKKLDTGSLGEGGPSEQEPNDFAEQATLLELGGDLRPVVAEIENETDRDWYALTSRNNETWQVEAIVTPSSDRLDPVVRVAIDGAEDAALTYDIAGPGEPEVIPILAVTPDPTRIYVRGKEASKGGYELTFKKRLSGGSIEAEPNDEVSVAEQFKAPGEIQGFHDRPNDRDVFYVPRKNLTGEVFDFEVSSTGYPQDIAVYGERSLETALVQLQVPPEEAARIPNLKLPEGALGIWIVSSAGESYSRDRSYRLRLLPHSPEAVELDAEPNDTGETAQNIALGDELAGYLHVAEDVDRFKIYVDGVPSDDAADGPDKDKKKNEADAKDAGTEKKPPEEMDAGESPDEDAGDAGSARMPVDPLASVPEKDAPEHLVRVDLTPQKESLRLALAHHESEAEPVVLEAAEAGEPVVLCNIRQDEGFVDVGVRLLSSEEETITSGFDYKLTSTDISEVRGLEIEPNDSMESPDRLEPGQSRRGFVTREGDTDIFAFGVRRTPPPVKERQPDAGEARPERGGEIGQMKRVTIRLEGNDLNMAFDVIDDEGGVVAEVNRAGVGGDEEIGLDLPSGLYYVRVKSARGFSCDGYEVAIEIEEQSDSDTP